MSEDQRVGGWLAALRERRRLRRERTGDSPEKIGGRHVPKGAP
jgi:hypothetical protein